MTQSNRKLIAEWSTNMDTVLLYSNGAIHYYSYVRWVNNAGSLCREAARIIGKDYERLLDLARQQAQDGVDYRYKAIEIARHNRRAGAVYWLQSHARPRMRQL